MTLLAPGRRAAKPAGRSPAPRAPLPAVIGLSLAPPAGELPQETHGPAALGASARLGAALLLVVGLLLQRTFLTLLPYGPADLVTVLVAGLACYAGPATGCLAGFGIGLAADVLSDHALGRLAAVLCVVGYLCGMVPPARADRLRIAWPVIAVACVAVPLLFALTGAFVGDTRAAGMLLVNRCLAGLCYGLLLAPLAFPLMRTLLAPHVRRRAGRRGLRRSRRTVS